MVDSTIKNEREQRKLYLRARQRVILSSVIGFLIAALVIALIGAFGFFDGGSKKVVTSQNNYNVATACLVEGDTVMNPSEVTVRVLNGTNKSGLGTAVGEELRNRGFSLQSVGDYDSSSVVERTEIRYGKAAIRQAYTLASHFDDAILRMDDRADGTVDAIIGASFNDLISSKKTPKPGAKMDNFPNCVAADKMTNLPKGPQQQEQQAQDQAQ